MFTGLIREIATVKSYKNNILTIQSKHKAKLGDSIAINGVCLTVIKVHSDGFDLELADETRSIIDESKISGEVHMEPAMMKEAVRLIKGQALVEASGGITLDNVRAVAETGVNLISIGALTHSATACDISMRILSN